MIEETLGNIMLAVLIVPFIASIFLCVKLYKEREVIEKETIDDEDEDPADRQRRGFLKHYKHDKVIVRSDNDEPYEVGHICEEHRGLPVVERENGDQVICFAIVLPYTDELADALDKLTPREQYLVCLSAINQVKYRSYMGEGDT